MLRPSGDVMRLVVSSDWHGDWVTDGYPRHGDLESALYRVMDECCASVVARRDTVFMFLGDLSNPYSAHVHRAVAAGVWFATNLADRGVRSLWLVGNHDVIEDQHGSHTLMAIEALSSCNARPGALRLDVPVRVRSIPGLEGIGGRGVLCLPYTSPARAYDPAAVVEGMECKFDIVAGHLNIAGITPGSESDAMARGREVFWPAEALERYPDALRLNGHYHQQQCFQGIHIPGSLLRLTHGEEQNSPGFLVFDL